MNNRLITEYTRAVLAFDFKDASGSVPGYASDANLPEFVTRMTRLLQKSRTDTLVLFGLGSGEHALALRQALPDSRLLVLETNPATARNFLTDHPDWGDAESRAAVLADTSPWALLYLLGLGNVDPERTKTVLNPCLSAEQRKEYQKLQRLFIQARPRQAINSSYLSHVGVQAPDLSVGVILHPDEPDLDVFFGQFPDWVREVVVIWDGETVPDREFVCAAPVRHLAHPLDDFASQRNRMLDNCQGEWVLYLDGDEMFSEDVWGLLTACLLVKRLEACWFPRMTLYPDEGQCKVGLGLWPDLQLRLFRNHESVRFTNPVHERLVNVQGRTALALDAPILHFSRLRKSPEELAAKLKGFDQTGDNAVHHRLNSDYPHMRRELLPEASLIMGSLQLLLLEENPA